MEGRMNWSQNTFQARRYFPYLEQNVELVRRLVALFSRLLRLKSKNALQILVEVRKSEFIVKNVHPRSISF